MNKRYFLLLLFLFLLSSCNLFGKKDESTPANITQTDVTQLDTTNTTASANLKILSIEKLNPNGSLSLAFKVKIQNVGSLPAKDIHLRADYNYVNGQQNSYPFIFNEGNIIDINKIEENILTMRSGIGSIDIPIKNIYRWTITWKNFYNGILSSETKTLIDSTDIIVSDPTYNYETFYIMAYEDTEKDLKSINANLTFTDMYKFRAGVNGSDIENIFATQGLMCSADNLGAVFQKMESVIDLYEKFSSGRDMDKAFMQLYLGYLYTLHSAQTIKKHFGSNAVSVIDNHYNLNLDGITSQSQLTDEQKQALVGAYIALTNDSNKYGWRNAGPAIKYGSIPALELSFNFTNNSSINNLKINGVQPFLNQIDKKLSDLGIVLQ